MAIGARAFSIALIDSGTAIGAGVVCWGFCILSFFFVLFFLLFSWDSTALSSATVRDCKSVISAIASSVVTISDLSAAIFPSWALRAALASEALTFSEALRPVRDSVLSSLALSVSMASTGSLFSTASLNCDRRAWTTFDRLASARLDSSDAFL